MFLCSHKILRVLFQEVEIHLSVTRVPQRYMTSRGVIKPQGLANLNIQAWRQLQNNADKVTINFNTDKVNIAFKSFRLLVQCIIVLPYFLFLM